MDKEPVHEIFNPNFEELIKETPKLLKHLLKMPSPKKEQGRRKDKMFDMMHKLTPFEWNRKLNKKETNSGKEIVDAVFGVDNDSQNTLSLIHI